MVQHSCPGEPGFECSDAPGWKGLCRRCYFRAYTRVNAEATRERNRRYKAKNRERVRAYNRQWFRENPEKMAEYYRRWLQSPKGRETHRRLSRDWARANPDKVREMHRRYYEANKEQVLEAGRKWREANPGKWAERSRRRRALERNALHIPFTHAALEARLSMFPGCWMCGGDADTVDHLIPIARGGPHCLSNLRPACRSCNASKGARTPSEIEELSWPMLER